MGQPGMAEKMEFIKMFKRMVKNLKYTQNFVCFAVGNFLLSPFKVLDNGLDKVFDNNLISKAASLSSLDQAFHDLYNGKIKKQKDHNDKASVNKVYKLSQDKKKGFSFLGYKILGETLRISTTSLQRLRANINRLYEQQASNARLGRYLEKWLRWAKGGVNNLISPINFNINPNPLTRMQVRVSNDMCHVFW
jgi:hypothetical protein